MKEIFAGGEFFESIADIVLDFDSSKRCVRKDILVKKSRSDVFQACPKLKDKKVLLLFVKADCTNQTKTLFPNKNQKK